MRKIQGRNGGTLLVKEKGDVIPGAGRPVGPNFKTIAAKFLNVKSNQKNELTGELEDLSNMERLFLSLADVALNSDNDGAKIAAIREILDRIEGKVSQPIDVAGEFMKPTSSITIVHSKIENE